MLLRQLFIFGNFVKQRQGFLCLRSRQAVFNVYVEICSGENVDLMALFRIDQVMHQFYVHELAFQMQSVV